ncbi:iron ABC transporter ATP-binding protein [Polaribacter sargassicola]|uniref:iron ABC transporter ATP-binding protein n=1 Tax=Polaribacter sargassicola TaxID=2836891 RepID=UPI001F01664E|nr:ATP-binding cassette domain-containing protein [Polaribacter sp. DS7-9]MCG1035312.1 ATP-binding cassette domain-containing protein [Polaribacter sp. DS7-9]
MIKTTNISKQYGDKIVVDNVTIEIPKGKITSLIGSNGAGKSTLLGTIARIINANHGEIIINEKNITDYKNRILAQELSILKQMNHLDLKLTVKELVSFGRFPYSQGRLTEVDHLKIKEAIAFLNLTELENNYLEELSGGQQQRAFLAMVVAQDTDYILLDEPLNNLDMRHSVQIMKTLKDLSVTKNKTIVMVIHDINFASYYSDYIAAMKQGKLIHFNTTKNIINPKILKEIYDIDFEIIESNNKLICNYYN